MHSTESGEPTDRNTGEPDAGQADSLSPTGKAPGPFRIVATAASARGAANDGRSDEQEAAPLDGSGSPNGPRQGRGHEHGEAHSALSWLREILPFGQGHSHEQSELALDNALETNDRGIWALKISLVGLGVTAVLQLVVAVLSGSVGLLADTIHNGADALTALPLWLAFTLSKRPPTSRYTYGYGRAEDIAGVFIVLMIAASAAIAAYESIEKLLNPHPVSHLWWVAAASVIGFLGNELVAALRVRVGKEIGSAALVADGQHARADGITSLGVLLGVGGVALGFPAADPLVGLLITAAILFILKESALTMWERLMDAVDPRFVETVESSARGINGVQSVHSTRVRWLGHRLQADLHVEVDEALPTRDSHRIVEGVRHALFHRLPRLADVNVHVDPCGHSGQDAHELTNHHAAAQSNSAPDAARRHRPN